MPPFKITNEGQLCFYLYDANVFKKKVQKSSSIAGTVWDKRYIKKKLNYK